MTEEYATVSMQLTGMPLCNLKHVVECEINYNTIKNCMTLFFVFFLITILHGHMYLIIYNVF